MKVRYAHLCDHTLVSQQGKPALIGIFNRVWSTSFPFNLGVQCEAFVCLGVEHEDFGQTKQVRLTMIDPEGRALFELIGEAHIEMGSEVGDAFLNWKFERLAFAEPGPHIFRVQVVGGGPPWDIDLMVQQRA